MPQGTIKTFDERTRSGIILDDQKNELTYDETSFSGMGIRAFRMGQRVKFAVEGAPPKQRVRNLTIVTL